MQLQYMFLVFATLHLVSAGQIKKRCSVQLPTGQYAGHHDTNTSVTTYYAIPYAHAERFRAPHPIVTKTNHTQYPTVINATTHGPACINFNLPPPYDKGFALLLGPTPLQPQSEDCLTLDIYVPDGDHTGFPVLFYTPGGGFLVGASFSYDFRPLVRRSMDMGKPFIAVVINYRLGPLGTLNPSVGGDVNVWLGDQVEALRWVKRYIGVFGGDKNKVTIMGQSAGAESTMHQLLFSEEPLFRAAWMASVPSSGGPFLGTTPKYKDELIQSYAEACGCPKNQSIQSNVDCLSVTDVHVMANASAAWEGSGTSLGGPLKENVFRAIRAGRYPKIPIVVSICRDEGTSQALGFNASSDEITSLAIQDLSRNLSREKASTFLQQMLTAYPTTPSLGCPFDGQNTTYGQPSQYKRMAAIFTDGTYTEAWTEYLKSFSTRTKTWGILFEARIPGPGIDPAFGYGHASDIPYYFPTLLGPANDPRRNNASGLVEIMQTALVNFVGEGDPNGLEGKGKGEGGGERRWPLFDEGKEVVSISGDGGAVPVPLPSRPGFEVIRRTLRPDGF